MKVIPRILALFLSLALALPNPAYALRVQAGMESASRPELSRAFAAGAEEKTPKVINAAAWDVVGAVLKERQRTRQAYDGYILLGEGTNFFNQAFSAAGSWAFSLARLILREKAPEMTLSHSPDGTVSLRFNRDGILSSSRGVSFRKHLDLKEHGLTLRPRGDSGTEVEFRVSGEAAPQGFLVLENIVNVQIGKDPIYATDDTGDNFFIQLEDVPKEISRLHLTLSVSKGFWNVLDQSANGTFVRAIDAQKFKEKVVPPQDIATWEIPAGLKEVPLPAEGLRIRDWKRLKVFNLRAADDLWLLSAAPDGKSIQVMSEPESDRNQPGIELPPGATLAIGDDPDPADYPAPALRHSWSGERSLSNVSISTYLELKLDPVEGLIIRDRRPLYGGSAAGQVTLSVRKIREQLQTAPAAGIEQEVREAVSTALNPAESLEWNLKAAARAVEQIRLQSPGSYWLKAGIKGERAFIALEAGIPIVIWFNPGGVLDLFTREDEKQHISYAALLGGKIGPKKFSDEFLAHHPDEPSDFAITFTTGQILDQVLRRNGRVTLVLTKNKKEVAARFAQGAVGRYDGNDPMTFLWMIPGRVDVYFDQASDPGEDLRARLSAAGMKVKGVFATPEAVGQAIAGEVLAEWKQKVTDGDQYVFGLVTGSTPKPFLDALMPKLKALADQARSGLLQKLSIVVPDDHVEKVAEGQFRNITRENPVSAYTTRKNDFVDPVNEGLPAGQPGMSMDRVMVPEVGKAVTQLDQLPGIDRYFLTFGPQHVFMQFAGEAENVQLFDPVSLIQPAGTEQVLDRAAAARLFNQMAALGREFTTLGGLATWGDLVPASWTDAPADQVRTMTFTDPENHQWMVTLPPSAKLPSGGFTGARRSTLTSDLSGNTVRELLAQATEIRRAPITAGTEQIPLDPGVASKNTIFITPGMASPQLFESLRLFKPAPGEQLSLVVFSEHDFHQVEIEKWLAQAGLKAREIVNVQRTIQEHPDWNLFDVVADKQAEYYLGTGGEVRTIWSFNDLKDLGRLLGIQPIQVQLWENSLQSQFRTQA